MINGKNKDLYYESSIHKQLNIEVVGTQAVIDNSMRERDTFTLTEALNDGSELKFGSCLPNQISFTAHDVPTGIIGKKLRPVETLEGNEDDPFVYGEYKIYSDTPTADRTKRQIVAYDAMYDIINSDVKTWYDGLSFPMTLKAFRDSFFVHLGIAQADTSLVNDGMTVNKTLTTSSSDDSAVTAEASVSGKTIIEAICEINGTFGNINRDGKFDYVILPDIISAVYPAEDLYPRNDLFPADSNTESMSGHYITFDYENFKCKAITQLEIRANDNTAGALVGTSGNNYVISGNFLVSDKTGAELEQIANNVFPIMKQAAYTPIKSSTCIGNPCLELGDPIRFNTSREIVETYILQRTLTGVQSKRDAITSQGLENYSKKNITMREMIAGVARRTSALERNADYLKLQFDDLDESTTSRLDMAANQIQAEVTRAMGIEGNLSSQLSMVAGEVSTKVSRGDVVSEINLSPDQITLRGNRLVVDSNNFQLDGNGNVYIVQSLGFRDSSYGGNTEIIGLSGKGDPVLENIRIDLNTVTDQNGDPIGGDVDYAANAGYANTAGSATNATYASYVSNTATSRHTANMYSTNSNKMYYCPQGSSRRFKTDIEPLKDEYLDPHRLYDVGVVQFKYKPSFYGLPDGTPMDTVIGFIAEDIEEKYPCATEYDEDSGNVNNWLERYMIPPMLALIQEQHKDIEQLKFDNFSLNGEVGILKQKLGMMEEMLYVSNSENS